jgi:hypothetical protein
MSENEARERLSLEIERIVRNAVRSGAIVRTGYYAGTLADNYSEAGYSIGHIVDALALAASRLGLPVELGRDISTGL